MSNQTSSGYDEIIGAIHLHSNYSDGEGSVAEILADAKEAGLDFLVLTDHDSAAARREGWEGIHGDVTLSVGIEITPKGRPHCLALGEIDCLGLASLSEREYLDSIAEQGGFAAIAHPEGGRKRELRINHRPWSMWDHPAVRAVEIWNYTHDWIENVHPFHLHEFYKYFLRPQTQINGPNQSVLDRWDKRAQAMPLAAIAGLDCHARSIPFINMQVFPYKDMFMTIRNHLRIPTSRHDCATILEAIASGAGFIGYDFLADSTGTIFRAECGCGMDIQMGQAHYCGAPAIFKVMIGETAHLKLLRNGKTVAENYGRDLEYKTSATGVYRVEAFIDFQPWVFTNHIYLKNFD